MQRSHDFLGLEVSGAEDRILVIAVPVEESTSYIHGTAGAPEAIIESSRQIELYNPSLDTDLEGSGIVTVRTGAGTLDEFELFLDRERGSIHDSFHCFIGGEHSITPVILDKMSYGGIGIVWLDAHADMRSEYLGNNRSHACAARNSLPFGRMVEVGVRSMSRDERDFLAESGDVEHFERWSGDAARAIDDLPGSVYLSIDFDALDPSILRAVGTPEPAGLAWDDLVSILDHVFEGKKVVGMDAVELCPNEIDVASSFAAAKTVYEALSRFIAGKGQG
jgi:agmatinase